MYFHFFQTWNVDISVLDEDKLTRIRETCNARINLKNFGKLSNGETVSSTINLPPIVYNFGQLLVALNYLPTAQRLSVNVAKASKLIWQHAADDLLDFRKYLKGYSFVDPTED